MASNYSYKSFLDDEENGNTFSYDHNDTNSSAWDSLNTPSSSSEQTNTQPTSPAYNPVASPPVQPQTDDPADKTRSDLIQARRDIVNAPNQAQNTDSADKYTSKTTGFTYDKPKESHANDAYLGVMGFLAGYLRNGDTGEGMDGAYLAVSDNQNKVDRFKNIDYYEQKGYNPVDINNYLKTGKEDDMIKNKTQWQSAGGGYIFDPSTGQFRNGSGTASGKQVDHTIDLGGSIEIHYKDGSVETKTKTQTPDQAASSQQKAAEGKQVDHTVDLGDRELIVYKDGTQEYRAKGVNPGTNKNPGTGVNGTVNVNRNAVLFNQQVGGFGYIATDAEGNKVFVHTSEKGSETKSGSDLIMTRLDDNGNPQETYTGKLKGMGQDSRLGSVQRSAGEALETGNAIADESYGTYTKGTPGHWFKNREGSITGAATEAQQRFDHRNEQIGAVMADRAVSSSNNAILKSDMELQVGSGGKISVDKSSEENQRIFNNQNNILLGSQIDAQYRNTHNGKTMPENEYLAKLYDSKVQYYTQHPEAMNAFSQKTFGMGGNDLFGTIGAPPPGSMYYREGADANYVNSLSVKQEQPQGHGSNRQIGSAVKSNGIDLGAATAPEGTTHTNSNGITARVVNGRWVQQ